MVVFPPVSSRTRSSSATASPVERIVAAMSTPVVSDPSPAHATDLHGEYFVVFTFSVRGRRQSLAHDVRDYCVDVSSGEPETKRRQGRDELRYWKAVVWPGKLCPYPIPADEHMPSRGIERLFSTASSPLPLPSEVLDAVDRPRRGEHLAEFGSNSSSLCPGCRSAPPSVAQL